MIDALGAPQSVLVLGATSDIAAATVDAFVAAGRVERVVLAGRPGPQRAAVADRLRGLGVSQVSDVDLDARRPETHEAAIEAAFAGGDIDVVLLALGVLPDQQAALASVDVALDSLAVNFTGSASVLLRCAERLRAQGHGRIVVLSSVAAERPRRSNFVYGAGKAGLDALAVGLSEELRGTGAGVLVVRPGFVRTRMTAGLAPAPLAVGPEQVAAAIVAHLRDPGGIIWVPASMRAVMTVLRHLPAVVFRRLPL